MIQRSRRGAVGAFGAAMALTLSLSAAGLAQEAPPALTSDITSYPNYAGGVDCDAGTFNGVPYVGNLKSIEAPDPQTVVFNFCNPNVSFREQVAFASLAIDDADYLIANGVKGADGSAPVILSAPNGTGPYKLAQWDRGNRVILEAFDGYWGEPARTKNVEFRWAETAAGRLVELLGGTVDGIDNVGPEGLAVVDSFDTLELFPRSDALNIFYLGMNNTYEPWDDINVRKAIALGIDRNRIVDNFYPPGSSVATHWTPCNVAHSCLGEPWYDFDLEAANALLDEAGFPDPDGPEGPEPRFETDLHLRLAVRAYLPDPPTIAQEIQTQLRTNLGIKANIDVQEGGTLLSNQATGNLPGIVMLGWNADYPDQTNFLDFFFAGGERFGELIPELVDALKDGAQNPDPAGRDAAYAAAENAIRENVPAAIVAHGANAAAFQSDVDGAHSSPLANENLSVMAPGDRDTLVWMQNQEPLSLYCGDESDGETLRACEQMKESLLAYKVAGTEVVPGLATDCTSNEDLTVWTCTLREGVKFHDGSELDASDVIVSYAAQWDLLSAQHVGNLGIFEYWPALIGGGYLNVPPVAE